MHNHCIRTSLLRENNFSVLEHRFYVDAQYATCSLLYVKTAVVYDIYVYQYLLGRNGQSMSIESRRKYIDDYYDVGRYMIEFYREHKKDMTQSQVRYYIDRIAEFVMGYYSTLLSYKSDKEKKRKMVEFDGWLKKIDRDIYDANKSICIKLLRKSDFASYKLSSVLYRLVNKRSIPD